MQRDNKRGNKILILLSISFFLLFFLSVSFISAQATPHTEDFTDGYKIVEKTHDVLPQYKDFEYDFYVYNQTTGQAITNSTVNCTFTLSQNNGTQLYSTDVGYDGTTWAVPLDKGNFSTLDKRPYVVTCTDGTFGGVLTGIFEVTPQGRAGTDNIVFSIFIIVFLVGLNLISFFKRNIPLTILTGMAVMFLGLYLVSQGIIIYRDGLTNYISYVVVGLGAITSFWAALEQLEVL